MSCRAEKRVYLAQQHIALEGIAADGRLDAEGQIGIAASWRDWQVWVSIIPVSHRSFLFNAPCTVLAHTSCRCSHSDRSTRISKLPHAFQSPVTLMQRLGHKQTKANIFKQSVSNAVDVCNREACNPLSIMTDLDRWDWNLTLRSVCCE